MRSLLSGLVVVAIALSSADALCVPGIAPNITLYSNYTLAWSPAINPQGCAINEYIINLVDTEQNIEYQFEVGTGTYSYYLYFVDMCKTYNIEVHALTQENILGPSEEYSVTTAPSNNIDLKLTGVRAAVHQGQIYLNWDLFTTRADKCVSYYRVVYWDDSNNPKDLYVTTNSFILKGEVACTDYSFQVNAIIANPDIQGPISEVHVRGPPEVPHVPSLISLNTTTTSANMTWKLPTYAENRCNLTALRVTTLGVPPNISDILVPVTDNESRPDITVRLTGLNPDNVYISHVTAINEAGPSKTITVTFQTTDNYVLNRDKDVLN